MIRPGLLTCPPLTTNELHSLRGKPAVKMAGPDSVRESAKKEEWIYFNAEKQEQEHYLFHKGRLTGWHKRSQKDRPRFSPRRHKDTKN